MKSKKGLSNVIATVLIVLLALAAIAIVWGFIQPSLTNAGDSLTVSERCLNVEVAPTACDGTGVTVQYVRGDGVQDIVAIVSHADGTTSQATSGAVTLLSTDTVAISGIADGDTARAAARVLDGNGNPTTCDPSPTEITCAVP